MMRKKKVSPLKTKEGKTLELMKDIDFKTFVTLLNGTKTPDISCSNQIQQTVSGFKTSNFSVSLFFTQTRTNP